MHRVQDWYTWFERKDLLVKRLLDVLNNGGWGEAQPLSNMLLPLLSKLPDELVTKDFYTTFFDAIFTGLNNRNLLSSKSERQTWIKILEECLRYLSVQNHEYVLEVVTYVHRTWLENVFAINNAQARNHLIKCSATNMASLVKYWLKQTKEGNSEKYDQLIRNFWLNIGSTIAKQIDQLSIVENENVTQLIESHILLLKTLKTMFASEGIKQRHIHFEDQKTVEDVAPPSSIEQFDVMLTDRFEHNLTDVVENTCCSYFDFVNNKEVSQAIFTALHTYIEEFESKNLLIALARHFKQETVYGFYETVLKQWLTNDTGCEPLVDIVFIVIKHLTQEEQDRTFETFQQFPPLVSEWCLSRAVSCPQGARSAARRWLHAPAAERSVAALGGRAAAGDARATRLLLACLAHDIDGEPLVSSAAVSRAVEQLGAACGAAGEGGGAAGEGGGAAACARHVLHELARAPHESRRLLAAPLLEVLFQHSLDHPRPAPRPAARACVAALGALPLDARAPLVSRARARLHAHVFSDLENLDIDRIAHAASLYPYLFVASEDTTKTPTEIVSHIKLLFDMETEKPKVPLEVYSLRCDCIDGNINCPFENDNEFIAKVVSESDDDYEELTRKDLMLFLYNSLFKTFVMREILCEDAEDSEDADEMRSRSEELVKEDLVKEELNRVFYDAAVLSVLVERYAFWSDYDLIIQGMQQMKSLIESILSVTTPETKDILLSHFSKNAAARGYYWSYARKLFNERINERMPARPNDTLESEVSGEDRSSGSRNIENNEIDDENTSKTPESEHSECLNVTDTVNLESLEDIVTGNGYFHSLQAERGAARGTRRVLMMRSVLAAHARDAALGEQLARDTRAGRAPADVIIDAYYRHNDLMLYKTELFAAPWSMIVSNAAIVQFLEEEVRTRGWDLPAHQWDFTTIALCSLAESLQFSEQRWGCCKVAVVARAVLGLLGAVHAFISGVRAQAERRRPSAPAAALPAEWRDVFAPELARHALALVERALDDEGPMSASRVATLSALAARLTCLPADAPGAPPARELVARAAAALRRVSPAARKYLAFATLDFLSETLVVEDAETLAAWCAREDESPRPEFSLGYFDDALVHLQDLLDAALSNVKVCEGTCEMLARSDSHSVALGLLLLAAHLLRHSARARADLAQFYIELLRCGAQVCEMLARSDSHSVALGLLLLAAHLLRHSARARADLAQFYIELLRCGAQVCEMLARSDSHSVALGLLLLAAHLLRHSARARADLAQFYIELLRCGAQVCEMLARSDSHSVALGLLLLAAHLLRHSARARADLAQFYIELLRCGAQVCEMLARSDSHSVALGLLLLAAHLLRHSARARADLAQFYIELLRCGAQVCEMLARSDSHSVALGLLLLAAHLLRHSARARADLAQFYIELLRCGAQVCEMLARSDSHSVALGLLLLAAHLLRHSARARADLAQFYIELLRCGAQVCEMLARSDSHSVALGLLLLAAHLLRHSARARADLAQFYIELLRCGAQVCEMLARSDSHSVALGLLLLAAHLLRHSARARADLAQFYIELLRCGAQVCEMLARSDSHSVALGLLLLAAHLLRHSARARADLAQFYIELLR
ncbi:unnamed protein product [Euphydryas editha]|nr:unnamed protein product [Euphydryas editha]